MEKYDIDINTLLAMTPQATGIIYCGWLVCTHQYSPMVLWDKEERKLDEIMLTMTLTVLMMLESHCHH